MVYNILLISFIALCSFFGVSNKMETAIGMGLAVIFVMTVSTIVAWILWNFLLVPLKVGEFLYIPTFILVIAGLVQFEEMFIRKTSPALYMAMGIYLPLITTNCAVLAAATESVKPGFLKLNIAYNFGLIESVIYTVGVALGYTVAIILFAAIRERIDIAPVPRDPEGVPAGLHHLGADVDGLPRLRQPVRALGETRRMDWMLVLFAVGVMAGTGLLLGGLLAVASVIFHVEVDPRVERIRAALPGANCGACGLPRVRRGRGGHSRGEGPGGRLHRRRASTRDAIALILGIVRRRDQVAVKTVVRCQGGTREGARSASATTGWTPARPPTSDRRRPPGLPLRLPRLRRLPAGLPVRRHRHGGRAGCRASTSRSAHAAGCASRRAPEDHRPAAREG